MTYLWISDNPQISDVQKWLPEFACPVWQKENNAVLNWIKLCSHYNITLVNELIDEECLFHGL